MRPKAAIELKLFKGAASDPQRPLDKIYEHS